MKALARIVRLLGGAAVVLLPLAMVAAATEEAPVELISCGVPLGKPHVAYKIKVNTDKPINEVHLNLKEMDAGGKLMVETTLVWANIVHSTRQPIEQGKTYEDDMVLSPGAVAAECSLKEVVYKDSTRWSATAGASMTPAPTRAASSPAPKTSNTTSETEGAENFIKSVYHAMEQDDPAKVLACFDETVDYYTYGPKDKAFIGEQLRQYFAAFPVRSFSVSGVEFQSSPMSNKASATFEVRYSLQSPAKETTTGRSHVEWELVKLNGVPKIIRFTGTSTPDS